MLEDVALLCMWDGEEGKSDFAGVHPYLLSLPCYLIRLTLSGYSASIHHVIGISFIVQRNIHYSTNAL